MAKKSLSEQIAELANPKVEDFDIENNDVFEHNNNSGSDISDNDDDELQSQHYVKVSKSKLRDNKPLVDEKYVGKVGSRKDLFEDDHQNSDEIISEDENSDEIISEDENSDEIISEEEDQDSNDSDSGMSFKTDSEDEAEANEIGDESAEESAEESENEPPAMEEDDETALKRQRLQEIVAREQRQVLNKLSDAAKNDAVKGFTILQQQKEFDSILDVRIKLQKAVTTSNLLPVDSFDKYSTSKTSEKLDGVKDQLYNLLDQIIALRSAHHAAHKIGSYEPKKKRSYNEYLKETSALDSQLKEYRNAVLNKWSSKISSASGTNALNAAKFKTINQSAEAQVENNLADMERLMKRARLNRRGVSPMGYDPAVHNKNEEDDEEEVNPDIPREALRVDKQENPYIFDDEDFYRVLLNDLVDKKISDTANNGVTVTLTKSKLKKQVDTKASKGRKLKFTVQEPIANFEAPINGGFKWSDEQIDEFFAGLLGQRVNFNENEEDAEEEEDEAIANDGIQIFG